MTADIFPTSNEKALSGALALAMHLMFLALLIFGVSWQKHQPDTAMIVDLWNNLPPVAAPKAEPVPEVKPEPEPPRPEPKVEPRAEPKPVPKPVPRAEAKPDMKAEIALRDKKEKERKAQEQALAEKKKHEQALAEKKRREQEQVAALRQQADAETKRLAREQEDALKKLAQQQAAAQTKLVDEYVGRIRDKIQRRINKAGCTQLSDPEVQLKVTLLPDGNVLGEPEVRKSSGGSPCDSAVTRAVLLAQPLPLPPDPALFPKFRELNLNLYPNR